MTKQKHATFSIPNISLFKGINQLIEVKQHKLFPLKQYLAKNLYLFNKKSKRQTHKLKHQIFGRDIFKTTPSSGNYKVFEENLLSITKNRRGKTQISGIFLHIFGKVPARDHTFSGLKYIKQQILKQEAQTSEALDHTIANT